MAVLGILQSISVSSSTVKLIVVLALPFLLLSIIYIIVVPNILKVLLTPTSPNFPTK